MQDYRAERRVSLVVRCEEERHPPEVRAEAVTRVLAQPGDPQWQWLTITQVASDIGIRPQTLRLWVQQAEQDTRREDAPIFDPDHAGSVPSVTSNRSPRSPG
jgi:transposase-like protein